MKYGKVFYYEVRISVNATGVPLGTYYVQYENETLKKPYGSVPNFYEEIIGYVADIPNGVLATSSKVYYYYNPNVLNETQWTPGPYPINSSPTGTYTCNSREVVIDEVFLKEDLIAYGTPKWRIYVTIPIGSYLWKTSGPMLVVGP